MKSCAALKPGEYSLPHGEHVISKKDDLPIFLDSHPLHHLYAGENAYLLEEYLCVLTKAGLQITQVLGPMATPINYFPATRQDWLNMIQTPFTWRFGYRITRVLLSDMLPWSYFINRYLANHADKKIRFRDVFTVLLPLRNRYDVFNPPHKAVLITGASGFIGRALARHFTRQQYKVYGIDRISPENAPLADLQRYEQIEITQSTLNSFARRLAAGRADPLCGTRPPYLPPCRIHTQTILTVPF